MSDRILAIIQARMGSSRLPGKVLLPIFGQPMLVRVVERARQARSLNNVVIATTTEASDDPVEDLCLERGYSCWRGSLHDVLDRYYQAARAFKADVVVRVTGDCPLIDAGLIDQVVDVFYGRISVDGRPLSGADRAAAAPYDFTANRLPPPWKRTYPIGLDTEVCSFQVLERAWNEALQPHHREHVMPYLYEQPGRFRVCVVDSPQDFGYMRWTVDTADDLEAVRQIYAHFPGRDHFSWLEVLDLLQRQPALARINASVQSKNYQEVDGQYPGGQDPARRHNA